MTMKSTELMIGDWVFKLEKGGHYRKGKIKAIIDDNVDVATSDGEIHTVSVNGVEPISLTAEILQKNGFCDKYGVICGVNCPEDNNLLLEISLWRNGFYWTINWNEYNIIRLRYVHELQHALKLCGINKTVEL